MTKMLDAPRFSGPFGSRCLHVVARRINDARDSAGFGRETRDARSDAVLSRSDAPPVRTNEAGFLKEAGLYRERVDLEIGRASERGARWWTRRLVRLYEDAGMVRFDK